MILIVICSASAPAQTLFGWPSDENVDLTTYTSLESCLAATQRVHADIKAHLDTLLDTMPTAKGVIRSLPDPVQDAAKLCMRRFPVEAVPFEKLQLAQQLYLIAGQDKDASASVARWLGAITDSGQRVKVLGYAIREYLSATPARFDLLQPLVDEFTRLRNLSDLVGLVQFRNLYTRIISEAERYDRQDIVQRDGQNFLSIMRARMANASQENTGRIRMWVDGINRLIYKAEFMDSLRTGTDAYARAQQQKMATFTQTDSTDYYKYSTSPSPKITGDFVFPVNAQNDQFPHAGTVTLFILLKGDQRPQGGGSEHAVINSKIRRLKQQFPALDIVLITATSGVLDPLAPPSPEEEAALFQEMLLHYAKLPATLIVSKRLFSRMPDPDRRVIPEPTQLELQTGWSLTGWDRTILVDKHGIIVQGMSSLYTTRDDDLKEMIQAVMDQQP